jgi:hypothetical protein
MPLRLEKHPKGIQDISSKAQGRRCKRSRRRVAKGKPAHVVTGASARELLGFMGVIAKEVPVPPEGQKTECPLAPNSAGVPTGSGRGAAPVLVSPSTAFRTPAGLLDPSVRQAPDGPQAGGRHPTAPE